jgi:hypothetical protein
MSIVEGCNFDSDQIKEYTEHIELKSTISPGIYCQQIGRALRPSPKFHIRVWRFINDIFRFYILLFRYPSWMLFKYIFKPIEYMRQPVIIIDHANNSNKSKKEENHVKF